MDEWILTMDEWVQKNKLIKQMNEQSGGQISFEQ